MEHDLSIFVLQLAAIVIAARLSGFVFTRYLKQPRVLGELVAGMAIGPFALGALRLPILGRPLFPAIEGVLPVSPELYSLATLASIVLLFLAGLETDLPTFLRFSLMGTAVGLGGVVVSFVFGTTIAVLLLPGVDSFMAPAALFLGTLSTATSVGITARILSEKRKMSSPEGVTILAGAVLDDVIGIVLLAVVVGVAKIGDAEGGVQWGRIGGIAAKAFGFWIVCTALGILVGPRLTRGLKKLGNLDVVTGISLGIALLLAGLSEMAGLAMIIGAYVTGLSLSQTDLAHELRERLHGVYQFLVPVFFCVMGMMVNFPAMKGILPFGLAFTVAAILGKILGCGLPALLVGFNLRGAFRIGAGMLPRGEVTLIVAGIGLSSGAIGPDLFGVAIVVLLIASVVAPPVLIASFAGGPGMRRQPADRTPERKSVVLDFPSEQIAEFIRVRIEQAFRREEFYVHRMDIERPIYQVRKEDIVISLVQEGPRLVLTTAPENEQLARFVVLEEVLELRDLLEQARGIKDPESMGSDLVSGLFSGDEQEADEGD